MSIDNKIKVLKDHGVPYKMENEKLIVDSMIAFTKTFEQTEDATNWSKNKLYGWLGH